MGKQAQRPPELYRIVLPVKNIKKASIFYSKLLDLKGKEVSPRRVYFECGQTILACYDPVAEGDSLRSGWNLRCKRIDKAIKQCPGASAYFMRKTRSTVTEHFDCSRRICESSKGFGSLLTTENI